MPGCPIRQLSFLLIAATWAPLARSATPARIRLTYTRLGTDRCPDEATLRREVSARLGYDPFQEPPEQTLTAILEAVPEGLRAHLTLSDAEGHLLGERSLLSRSSDCGELDRALVLALALAIDPLGIAQPAAEPPKPPEPAVAAPPGAPVPRPSLAPTAWSVALGPVGSIGAAPSVAAGLTLSLEARWPRFSVGLEGHADLPTSVAASGGSVEAFLLFAQIVPCVRVGLFGACALLAVGAEEGQGVDLPEAQPVTSPFVGAGARVLFELPLAERVSLRAQADLLAPLVRTSLQVGTVEAWINPAVSGALGAMVVVRFL